MSVSLSDVRNYKRIYNSLRVILLVKSDVIVIDGFFRNGICVIFTKQR